MGNTYETAILLAFSTHLLLLGFISLIGRKVHHPPGAVAYATFNIAVAGLASGFDGIPAWAGWIACIEIGAAVILAAVEIPAFIRWKRQRRGDLQGKA